MNSLNPVNPVSGSYKHMTICEATQDVHSHLILCSAIHEGHLRLIGARENDVKACREFLGRYNEQGES